MNCRIDRGTRLTPVLDLGLHYVTDFVAKEDLPGRDLFPLTVGVNPETHLAQLFHSYPPERMYKTYWYRSSVSEVMRAELKSIVDSVKDYVRLKPGDIVLDIASNDGQMLTDWPSDYVRIGIDPSDVAGDSELYKKHGITLVNDYFSKEVYDAVSAKRKAKVITLIAMFYDLDDPVAITRQIAECLDKDGVLILQMSYTPLMLEQNAFDNVGHEHLCYYNLRSLATVLHRAGLAIQDVQLNAANGGSFRVYVQHKGAGLPEATEYHKSIYKTRVQAQIAYELKYHENDVHNWTSFSGRVDSLKSLALTFLKRAKAEKKLVVGYGASTKGNTLLQHYNITQDLMPFIAERSEPKWGKYTVGSGIPIISEEEMRKMTPDYLFVLPWHFAHGMAQREKELLARGTQLVIPLPQVSLLGKDGWKPYAHPDVKFPVTGILGPKPWEETVVLPFNG